VTLNPGLLSCIAQLLFHWKTKREEAALIRPILVSVDKVPHNATYRISEDAFGIINVLCYTSFRNHERCTEKPAMVAELAHKKHSS
jgi:hypothetical protein